jgi:Nif-specific regulatory protein
LWDRPPPPEATPNVFISKRGQLRKTRAHGTGVALAGHGGPDMTDGLPGCRDGRGAAQAPAMRECSTGVCRGRIVPLLDKMGRMLAEDNDFGGALTLLLAFMRESLGMARGMVSLHHRESGRIFVHKSIGLTPEEQERGVYSLGEGITGNVVERARPMVVPRIGDEPAFLNRTGSLSDGLDLELSFMCVPIVLGTKVLGTISAERRYDDPALLDKHLDALVVVAHLLAQAVELYLAEHVDKADWERRASQLTRRLTEGGRPASLIGESGPMRAVYRLIRKVAPARATVLLLGESGVGKEMIADALHRGGPAPEGPMVKFNCAALPESLVESELFGHEKGAFTGADRARAGRFEEADGGTLFLDEVGELSLAVQAKLLRVLQERRFERVGGSRGITVNLRVIAATNRDLADMVARGSFRRDLYYRLSGFPIVVPPLRERGADVALLAEHFTARFARETEKPVRGIAPEAVAMLMAHAWPGNVRELENVIHRAVILAEGELILPHDLPLSLNSPVAVRGKAPDGLETRLASIEYELLVETLRRQHGNATRAAQALGITRRSMGLRMKRFNLSHGQFRGGGAPPARRHAEHTAGLAPA